MRILLITSLVFLFLGWLSPSQAQSTTGGRSGGSSASTGAGYETSGKRPAAGSPSSMTVADEGSARNYLYVPPTASSNRAASPVPGNGERTNPTGTKASGPASNQKSSGRKSERRANK